MATWCSTLSTRLLTSDSPSISRRSRSCTNTPRAAAPGGCWAACPVTGSEDGDAADGSVGAGGEEGDDEDEDEDEDKESEAREGDEDEVGSEEE